MQSPVLPISAPSCLLQRLARGFRCGYCPAHPQKAERGSGGGPAGVWVAPWQTDSGVVVSASPWRISACLALRFCVVRGLSYRVLASGAHKVSLHDSDSCLSPTRRRARKEGKRGRQEGAGSRGHLGSVPRGPFWEAVRAHPGLATGGVRREPPVVCWG